jgi:hypothetical protein
MAYRPDQMELINFCGNIKVRFSWGRYRGRLYKFAFTVKIQEEQFFAK